METIIALISIVAAIIALGQVYLVRTTAHGELLHEVVRRQSEPDARDDRAHLYRLASKPFSKWSAEEYACVERVATILDQVGFLIKHRYVTMRAFMTWHSQVVLCYQVAEPLIQYRRAHEGVPPLFLHFEWLARSLRANRKKSWWEHNSWRRLQHRTATLSNTVALTRVVPTRRGTDPNTNGAARPANHTPGVSKDNATSICWPSARYCPAITEPHRFFVIDRQ